MSVATGPGWIILTVILYSESSLAKHFVCKINPDFDEQYALILARDDTPAPLPILIIRANFDCFSSCKANCVII